MKCFVDTSAFVALYHRTDAHHEDARRAWTSLKRQVAILYTTRDVIGETITLIRRRAGHQQAVVCGNDLWESPVLDVVRPDARQDRDAWQLFQRHADQELSFVDCLSFVVMRELRLRYALTFDADFVRAGFVMVSTESSEGQ